MDPRATSFLSCKCLTHKCRVWLFVLPSLQSLTGYGAGTPYPTYVDAYMELYYYAVKGIQAAKFLVSMGGPAATTFSAQFTTLADAMLGNSSISRDLNFLSYHSYDQGKDTDAADRAKLKAILVKHSEADLKVLVTHWNFADQLVAQGSLINDPRNSFGTDAISYVGRRLVTFFKEGFAGANLWYMGATNDDTKMGQSGIFRNSTFTPKVQTYRLMSVILGLGHGYSQIVATIFNPAVITATVAAFTSAGIPVLCAVNEGTASTTVALSLSGLKSNQQYNISVWEASATDPTNKARQFVLMVTDSLGSAVVPNIAVIGKSVVGLVLTQILR